MKLLVYGSCPKRWPVKLLLSMRITAALLLIGALHVSANGKGQTVSYSGKNVRLEKVFAVIKKQTGYVFFYKLPDLEEARPVTVALRSVPVKDALEEILQHQSLEFAIEGNTIVIFKKKATTELQPAAMVTPPDEVKGRVTSEAGNPLEGVTVSVKGTKQATSTNTNGEFTIENVAPDAVLVFSS